MKPDDDADDRAWRSIVENYGDRAELDDAPPPSQPPPSDASSDAPSDTPSDAPFGGRFGDPRSFHVDEPAARSSEPEEDGYTPPEPPPLPIVAPDRGLAWAGVLGSPIVLLAALIFGISIPTWLGYLLVMGFVGGFLYLVLKMPREPRDPWDDGAQV